MYRRLVAIALFPLLLGQQCVEPDPGASTGMPAGGDMPQVTFHTSMGDVTIELFVNLAPNAATNFKSYYEEGYYDDAIIHGADPLFISTGQYKLDLTKLESKPLVNESDNGLTNFRGRVALLGPDGTESGVPQFVISLGPNDVLDYIGQPVNYTVIGQVADGMDVVDAIAQVETTSETSPDNLPLTALPTTPIMLNDPDFTGDYTFDDDGDGDDDDNDDGDDGDDDGDNDEDDNDVNHDPMAEPGEDRVVATRTTVNLDGSASTDEDDDILSYSWRQTAGPTVTINNADQAKANFTAPDTHTILVFELTVSDDQGGTSVPFPVELTVTDNPQVYIDTDFGWIVLALYMEEAPVTTLNFLQYVEDGYYDGTLLHRVVPDFVIQGGGYLPGLTEQSGIRDSIVNEFSPDRSNVAGTVAMAKMGGDPDSATSQFFFNLTDNSENLDNQNEGFTVFAVVTQGMDVLEEIAGVETADVTGPNGLTFYNNPVEDVVILDVWVEE